MEGPTWLSCAVLCIISHTLIPHSGSFPLHLPLPVYSPASPSFMNKADAVVSASHTMGIYRPPPHHPPTHPLPAVSFPHPSGAQQGRYGRLSSPHRSSPGRPPDGAGRGSQCCDREVGRGGLRWATWSRGDEQCHDNWVWTSEVWINKMWNIKVWISRGNLRCNRATFRRSGRMSCMLLCYKL